MDLGVERLTASVLEWNYNRMKGGMDARHTALTVALPCDRIAPHRERRHSTAVRPGDISQKTSNDDKIDNTSTEISQGIICKSIKGPLRAIKLKANLA